MAAEVPIPAIVKRGFLRELKKSAAAAGITLAEAISAAQSQIFTPNFQRGRILVSTSGSGQSGSFEIGVSGKDFTQPNVFGMLEQFQEILTDVIAAGTPDGTDEATLNTLFAAMCDDDRLARRPSVQFGDFTALRCS